MEIKKEMRNELLKRQEIEVVIESEKNPSFNEARKTIAEKYAKPEENVDVYSIMGKFGRKKFDVKAYIYDTKNDLETIKKLQLTRKKRKELVKQAEDEKKKSEEERKAEGGEKKTGEGESKQEEEKKIEENKEIKEAKPEEAA